MIAQALTVFLAFATSFVVDWLGDCRGLLPPAFRSRNATGIGEILPALVRRLVGFAAVAFVLWVGVFAPLLVIGQPPMTEFSNVPISGLFLLHSMIAAALLVWLSLGFFGTPGARPGDHVVRERHGYEHLGLATTGGTIKTELGLGLFCGVGAWAVVLSLVFLFSVLVAFFVGEQALPAAPPAMVIWIAGLPVVVRCALSLSAGVVEEIFFRGFLQPRIGIVASTALFVMAHASYGQLPMLVGIALLSFAFALLTRWRGNVWAAIVGHTVFDLLQLFVVIPSALKASSEIV